MQNRAMLALAAVLPLAAAQSLTVTSNCDFPIYLWNVVNSYGAGPPTTVLGPGNSVWSSPFESKNSGGGASIKLKLNNNIFDGLPLSQIEYKLTGSQLFYDWSLINGAPLAGQLFQMSTSDPSCPTLTCPAGQDYCPGAYYQPDDVATLACDGTTNNLFVTICGGNSGSSGSSSPAPSSAAPPAAATTAAPSAAGFLEGQSNAAPVVATQIVTTVIPVYVTEHLPAVTAQVGPDGVVIEKKRDAHLHAHQHAHRMADKVQGRHYRA